MSFGQDKRGRWYVSVMVNHERAFRRLPQGATARDAKQLEAELVSALGKHRAPVIPGDPPMMEILALYVEHAKRSLRSPDTAEFHARRAAPWAEKYRASEAMQCAAHMIRDMTGHYAPATINRTIGAIKRGLTLAWHTGSIPENYGAKVHRLAEHNQRDVIPTVEDVAAIANQCSMQARAVIWIALLTGARRGEVCQIDPAKHIRGDRLEVPASHTKTMRIKSMPITSAMVPWLEYFPVSITVDGVKSAYRRARVKAGLEHVNFHDLRHACASMLIEAGEDLYTVKEVLGHTQIQTTTRYAHLQMGKKRAAMDKLGVMVGQAAEITSEITSGKKKAPSA